MNSTRKSKLNPIDCSATQQTTLSRRVSQKRMRMEMWCANGKLAKNSTHASIAVNHFVRSHCCWRIRGYVAAAAAFINFNWFKLISRNYCCRLTPANDHLNANCVRKRLRREARWICTRDDTAAWSRTVARNAIAVSSKAAILKFIWGNFVESSGDHVDFICSRCPFDSFSERIRARNRTNAHNAVEAFRVSFSCKFISERIPANGRTLVTHAIVHLPSRAIYAHTNASIRASCYWLPAIFTIN